MQSLGMAGGERSLAQQSAAQDAVSESAPSVQQAYGVSAYQGSVAVAGGNVSIQTIHNYAQQQPISIVEVLRLVPNLRKIHLDVLSKATPGTAIWILKTDYFLLWLEPNGDLKILWGTGIPGAGKSVMASVVINDLERRAAASSGTICVAYLYFRYSDAADLTVRGVLEILVKQTVERHPECAALAEQAYTRHLKERTQPTQAELLQLLHSFTKVKAATFYVLDALDEAPEKLRVDIVRILASLNVKLFITSRPLKTIEAKFTATHGFTIVAQNDDLDLHISQEILRGEHLGDLLDADPSFKQEVISSVKKNCGGMFLHASLQLEAISRCTSAQDISETLAEFPSNIIDVYHQTWKRILTETDKNVLLAKAVFVWVLNAARSMTIEELRHAIATHPDTHVFEHKRLVPAATLLSLCCGLIVVEEETKFVRLIHYTAKETLKSFLCDSFPHPHSLLAAVCITHLTGCGFQETKIDSEEEFTGTLRNDPLLAYASEAWSTHARACLDRTDSRPMIVNFISQCRAFPSFTSPDRTKYFDILVCLHVLAIHNLPFTLIAGEDIGNPNVAARETKMTPLMLASWCGNIDMVKALLGRQEVDINLVERSGWSALAHAAHKGHEGIAEALLSRPEIQVNLVNNEGWSALIMAARNGCEGIAKALLARPEIQVNLVDNDGWSALMMAARYGHEGIAKALLARPEIQVNLVDNEAWSALMSAARYGYEGIATALLARPEIQVNLVINEGWSALIMAAGYGYEGIARALLARPEIQVNLVNNEAWSALIMAACNGHEGIAEALLARPEIQVNLVRNDGWSALMEAADEGHHGIVQLLLDRPETRVHLALPNGQTALTLASVRGHSSITKLLSLPSHQELAPASAQTPMSPSELELGSDPARTLDGAFSFPALSAPDVTYTVVSTLECAQSPPQDQPKFSQGPYGSLQEISFTRLGCRPPHRATTPVGLPALRPFGSWNVLGRLIPKSGFVAPTSVQVEDRPMLELCDLAIDDDVD